MFEAAYRFVFGLQTNLPCDFNHILCSTIDETTREFLGLSVLTALHEELRAKYDVGSDELPYRTETMYKILEDKFDVVGAKTIGPLIAERFYAKLGLDFHNHEGYSLLDYVQAAKSKLSN